MEFLTDRLVLNRNIERWVPGRLHLTGLLLLVLLLVLGMPTQAWAGAPVVVIKSAATDLYDEVINSARQTFRNQCKDVKPGCESLDWLITDIESESELNAALGRPVEAVVTVGEKAASWLSQRQHIPGPVLFSLIPRSTFDSIRTALPGDLDYTALYLDQPLSRQLRLIRAAFPTFTEVGVLTGPVSRILVSELRGQAKMLDLNIVDAQVENFEQIGPELKDLMDDCDVLLSLPDPLVFNQRTVFSILLSTYHNRIPVVGFSSSYVRAGALIGIHSTPEQIGQQLGEVLSERAGNSNSVPPRFEYPRYFSIARNDSVARSLQIRLPDDATLLRQLEEAAP